MWLWRSQPRLAGSFLRPKDYQIVMRYINLFLQRAAWWLVSGPRTEKSLLHNFSWIFTRLQPKHHQHVVDVLCSDLLSDLE